MILCRLPPLFLLATAPLVAQQLEWTDVTAATTAGLGDSTFTSVEAVPAVAPDPEQAFACGQFTGSFNIGGGSAFTAVGSTDGVIVAFEKSSGWNVAWKLQISTSSTGLVELRDIAVSPAGEIIVCGVFEEEAVFSDPSFNLVNSGGPHGFVALYDPPSLSWSAVYETPGIEPVSLVADPGGGVILTGPGTLAAAFDSSGSQLWSASAPAGTTEWAHVALDPTSGGLDAYVMTERTGSPFEVVLEKIDVTSAGAVVWSKRMGSTEIDHAGGLDVAPDGDVRLTFGTGGTTPSYDGTAVPGAPFPAATRTIAARIRPDGSPDWLVPVGSHSAPALVETADLDCDANGNSWLAARFDGSVTFENQTGNGDNDAALLSVDGAGMVYEVHRTSGEPIESPLGVAASSRESAMIVGSYIGTGSGIDATYDRASGSSPTLPDTTTDVAVFAPVEAVPSQNLIVFSPIVPAPVDTIIATIEAQGGQVYAVAESPVAGISVSAWVTAAQEAAILATDPNISSEAESFITPNGSIQNADWALGYLNNAGSPGGAPYSFRYPDTGGVVIIHLIDTAIDGLGGWFSGNPNLTIGGERLIRGAGDPTTSSLFQHGCQMLSLIAGPETGVAAGTPVIVRSYDIYPSGNITTSSLLADAILEAISVHDSEYRCLPGIICIASSSTATANSATLNAALSLATSSGLGVVLSAGNSGADASLYVPQKYAGSGILCVGASTTANARWPGSNHGASVVDCYAPGENVRVVRFPDAFSGYDSFNGTSASSAIAAGIAAVHLSINPWQSPSDLESSVTAGLYSGTVDIAQLTPAGPAFSGSFADWATWHGFPSAKASDDTDGDGIIDGFEYVLGLTPCDQDDPSLVTFSIDATDYDFGFSLSSVLFDPAHPQTLRDGSTWEVTTSGDLNIWTTRVGTITPSPTSQGLTPVNVTGIQPASPCFFRLEVTHAP